jgi:outer membrane lipoprotein SlyB
MENMMNRKTIQNQNYLKHIKQALNYSAIGSLGIVVAATISGCGGGDSQSSNENNNSSQNTMTEVKEAKNMFFVIQENDKGGYDVVEKHPTSGETRALLKDKDGNERMLSEAEIKKLAEEEAKKVEDGTSNLIQEGGANAGGMSLGETILAAAGGAILGSLIGNAIANKMNNNQNFQQSQRNSMNRTSAISRSVNKPSMNKTTPTTGSSKPTATKSGFFNKQSTNNTTKTTNSFGG